MLPQKILKFRVSEMLSPGFSARHFRKIMQQKCSRKLLILTISLVFSVSYGAPKRKKNTKPMKKGHKQRARRRPLRRTNSVTNLSISTFLCLCI